MVESRGCNAQVRIEDRDVQLLEDLFWQRLMSSGQIRRLGYFSSQSRCNRRLSQLHGRGYIIATPNSTDVIGPERLFHIGKLGRQFLLAQGLIDTEDASAFRKPPSRTMSCHLATLTEIRCRLHESGSLEKWVPEARCRHTYFAGNKLRVFKPDGFALIRSRNCTQANFIEADLGNASRSQIDAKIMSYEKYQFEAFKDVYGVDSFHVLFVAPTLHRIHQLRRFVGKSLVPVSFTTPDLLSEAIR